MEILMLSWSGIKYYHQSLFYKEKGVPLFLNLGKPCNCRINVNILDTIWQNRDRTYNLNRAESMYTLYDYCILVTNDNIQCQNETDKSRQHTLPP